MKSQEHPKSDFVSSEKLAPVLDVSSRTVRRMKEAGLLPFYVVGSSVKYRVSECLAAMEKLRVAAKTEGL